MTAPFMKDVIDKLKNGEIIRQGQVFSFDQDCPRLHQRTSLRIPDGISEGSMHVRWHSICRCR
ncbi:MAG: hypothetical protein ABS94_11060 [Variovorax sp. SCN 67-85]|nr:MAG: hypothetical protein ABS94_11060 [Variovorax sp. SCN 67-85]ODV23139.1 MAG: hypothetical protein ABT25_19875 [Variovorax sp. SCN 67-20]